MQQEEYVMMHIKLLNKIKYSITLLTVFFVCKATLLPASDLHRNNLKNREFCKEAPQFDIYTIVLTPSTEEAVEYIEASETLYSECQPSYLLTHDGTSSPHITVVQFKCESLDCAYEVWAKICEKMEKEEIIPLIPPFVGVAFIDGVGIYENTTWVELSVKRGDRNSPMMKVHDNALKALEEFGLKPLNACDNDYRPHLTLARIVMPKQIKSWPKDLCKKPGFFNLELGRSDEKWQYAQTIDSFPPISR